MCFAALHMCWIMIYVFVWIGGKYLIFFFCHDASMYYIRTWFGSNVQLYWTYYNNDSCSRVNECHHLIDRTLDPSLPTVCFATLHMCWIMIYVFVWIGGKYLIFFFCHNASMYCIRTWFGSNVQLYWTHYNNDSCSKINKCHHLIDMTLDPNLLHVFHEQILGSQWVS